MAFRLAVDWFYNQFGEFATALVEVDRSVEHFVGLLAGMVRLWIGDQY